MVNGVLKFSGLTKSGGIQSDAQTLAPENEEGLIDLQT